jgi:phosphotransferase system enzyme I (PtsP)
VPAISDVLGLFRWASDGDVALIDADHGLIVINPSKTEVAALRKLRKDSLRKDGAENDAGNSGHS